MEMTTNLYKGGIVFFSLQIPQINLRVHFIGDMAQSSSGRLLLLLAIEVKYFSFGVQKEKKEKEFFRRFCVTKVFFHKIEQSLPRNSLWNVITLRFLL